MGVVIEPQMTVTDAANLARTSPAQVRGAVADGDLRDLRRPTVMAWARACTARAVARALKGGGDK